MPSKPRRSLPSSQTQSDADLLHRITTQVLTDDSSVTGSCLPLPFVEWTNLSKVPMNLIASGASFVSPLVFKVLTTGANLTRSSIDTASRIGHFAFLNGMANALLISGGCEERSSGEEFNNLLVFHCARPKHKGQQDERELRRRWLIGNVLICSASGIFTLSPEALSIPPEMSSVTPAIEILRLALEEVIEDEAWRLELKMATSEEVRATVLSEGAMQSGSTSKIGVDMALAEPSVLAPAGAAAGSGRGCVNTKTKSAPLPTAQHLWYASPAAIVGHRVLSELANFSLEEGGPNRGCDIESVSVIFPSDSAFSMGACDTWWRQMASNDRSKALQGIVSQTKGGNYVELQSAIEKRFESLGLCLGATQGGHSGVAWSRLQAGAEEDAPAVGALLFEALCLWPLDVMSGRVKISASFMEGIVGLGEAVQEQWALWNEEQLLSEWSQEVSSAKQEQRSLNISSGAKKKKKSSKLKKHQKTLKKVAERAVIPTDAKKSINTGEHSALSDADQTQGAKSAVETNVALAEVKESLENAGSRAAVFTATGTVRESAGTGTIIAKVSTSDHQEKEVVCDLSKFAATENHSELASENKIDDSVKIPLAESNVQIEGRKAGISDPVRKQLRAVSASQNFLSAFANGCTEVAFNLESKSENTAPPFKGGEHVDNESNNDDGSDDESSIERFEHDDDEEIIRTSTRDGFIEEVVLLNAEKDVDVDRSVQISLQLPPQSNLAQREKTQPLVVPIQFQPPIHQYNQQHPEQGAQQTGAPPLDLIAWDAWQFRMDLLSDDIVEMASMLKTVADRRRPWQGGALSQVQDIASSLWPTSHLTVYGSFETGLAIPPSDIDVVVSGVSPTTRVTPRHHPQLPSRELTAPVGGSGGVGGVSSGAASSASNGGNGALPPLEALARELSGMDWVQSVTQLPKAAVPLIKLQTATVPTAFGHMAVIKMDISFNFTSANSDPSNSLQNGGSSLFPSFSSSSASLLRSYVTPQNRFSSTSTDYQQQQQQQQQMFRASSNHAASAGQQQRSPDKGGRQGAPGGQSAAVHMQHMGVENTRFVSRLCALHPPLAALVLILKQLLHEKGLNDPYKGGLGAYALTVMAASVCQRHALQPPTEKPNIGMLLASFFEVFGTRRLDPRRSCVSLSPAGPLLPLAPHHFNTPRVGSVGFWRPAPPVVVLDPLNPALNVAQSCFGFRQVQLCFDESLSTVLSTPISASSGIHEYSGTNRAAKLDVDGGDVHVVAAGQKSVTSVLGAMFGATHHRHVVNLSASIWCPFENTGKSTNGANNRNEAVNNDFDAGGCGGGGVFNEYAGSASSSTASATAKMKPAVMPTQMPPEKLLRENGQLPSSYVSSLSVEELEELRSLLGRATPLSNVETLRVQRLMKQTNPKETGPRSLPPASERVQSIDTSQAPLARVGGLTGLDRTSQVSFSATQEAADATKKWQSNGNDFETMNDQDLRQLCKALFDETLNSGERKALVALAYSLSSVKNLNGEWV